MLPLNFIETIATCRQIKCLSVLMFFVGIISNANAQCVNQSNYGSIVAPTNGTVIIDYCNYYGEYSDISGVQASTIYSCSILSGGYITIRQGSYHGNVIASGPSPLTWTSTSPGIYYAHWNADNSCGTSYACQETSLTYVGPSTSCTGTPNAGTSLANGISGTFSACVNSAVTLSLGNTLVSTGLTYQWRYSSTGLAGSFAAISGATTSTYSIANYQNANQGYYECKVTCTANNQSTTSTVMNVNTRLFTDCYCASSAISTSDEEIFNVTLNGASTDPMYSFSNACTNLAPGQGSSLSAYSNFKSLGSLVSLPAGSQVNFQITADECDGPVYYQFGTGVWIDFNQNGSFNDPGESVLIESAVNYGPRIVSGLFTVPAGALTGMTGMRVIVAEGIAGNLLNPCLQYNYGETEDYLVTIVPNVACTGTPNPGNTIATPSSVCSGSTVILSLQNYTPGNGVSYQWYDNTGMISGATNATATITNFTNPNSYHCVVTCGSATASSVNIPVGLSSYLNCYCTPNSISGTSNGFYGLISSVSLNTLTHYSSFPTNAPYHTYVPSSVATTTLLPGSNYNLAVNVGGFTQAAAWFDWNRNGVFEASEYTYLGSNSSSSSQLFNQFISVPTTTTPGTVRFRLRSEAFIYTINSNSACQLTNYGESEDYFISIASIPPCNGTPIPGNTIASATSACAGSVVTLTLQNNNTGSGVAYQWYENSIAIAGATSNYYLATINSTSTYYCTLQCLGNGLSASSNPATVTLNLPVLCYCNPVYTIGKTDGDLIAEVAINGTSLLNNSGSVAANPSFTYYQTAPGGTPVNQTASLQAGNSYVLTVTFGAFPGGGQHAAAWIDYNDDGSFGFNERIGYTATGSVGASAITNFPIILNCSPALGVHRMRIRNVFGVNGINIDPCATYAYGETEDYDITVTTALPCPQPTALTATLGSATSATLNWTAGCTETLWDVHVTTQGAGLPSSGIPSHPSVSNPILVNSLVASSYYEYWVRANCGGSNGVSTWSGPFYFSTIPGPCTGTPAAGIALSNTTNVCLNGSVVLTLTGQSINSGIAFQWYNSASGPISGATSSSYTTPGLSTPQTYYCQVTCINSGLSSNSNTVSVSIVSPGPGTSFSNPIMVGQAPCAASPFIDIQTNSTANCFNNSFGQASPEVWYKFTLSVPSTVHLSHCGTAMDTYISLLDSSGVLIAANDDYGPLCAATTGSLVQSLAAGTYYVVSEGYGANVGPLTTGIHTTLPCNTILSVTCFIEAYLDGAGALLPVLANQGQPTSAGVCDSIDVNLHDVLPPHGLLYSSRSVLLQNGSVTAFFPPLSGSYYIVLSHRNALTTWSAAPVTMSSTVSYNFSTAAAQAYGGVEVEFAPGVFALYSGDVIKDASESTDLLDLTQVETDISNFGFGYLDTDLNGDGNVDILDTPQLENNIANFIFTQRP